MIIAICDQSNIVQLFLILKYFIVIACTIVPIIIIAMTIKDLIIGVTKGEYEELTKSAKNFVKRGIAGLAIFFLPTIINYLFTEIVPGPTQELFACIDSASADKVKELKAAEEAQAKAEREKKEGEIEEANEKSAEAAKQRAAEGDVLKKDRSESSNTNNSNTENSNVEVTTSGISVSEFNSTIQSMNTPTLSEIESAASQNGISSDYLKVIIGTTEREGYASDPFLSYGWASAMINNQVSVDQMQGWDPYHSGDANYYSWSNINKGYNSASATTLKAVYLALTKRNTKIIECNGMYSTTPSNYNLIYKSSQFNASVYEVK